MEEPELTLAQPQMRVVLRPPPVVTPSLVASLAFGSLVAISLLVGGQGAQAVGMASVVLFLSLTLVGLSWRASRNIGHRTLTLFRDRLMMPFSVRASQMLSVPLRDVTGVMLQERGRHGIFLVGTELFDFSFPLGAFSDPSQARRFRDAILEQLKTAVVHGERTVESFEREEARVAPMLVRWPLVSFATSVLLLLVSLGMFVAGAKETFGVLVMGGLNRDLVLSGQLWRVVSYAFVHPVNHLPDGYVPLPSMSLILSLVGLWLVGPPIERLLGRLSTVTLMLGSAIGGGLVVGLGHGGVLVAGSAAIVFGLLGASVFIGIQRREQIPLGFRGPFRRWLWGGVLGVLLTMLPAVTFDLVFSGAIMGVLVAALAGPSLPVRGSPRWALAGSIGLGLVTLIGLGAGLLRAGSHDQETWTKVIETSQDGIALNTFAWLEAVDPDTTPERLERAEMAAKRALGLATEAFAPLIEDTVATVDFRQGQVLAAIEREAEALALSEAAEPEQESSTAASQLARFLLEAQRRGLAVDSATTALSLQPSLADDGRLMVEARWPEGPPTARMTVLALLQDQGESVAVVRLALDPESEDEAPSQIIDTPFELSFGEQAELRILQKRKGGDVSRIWRFVREVADYPGPLDASS